MSYAILQVDIAPSVDQLKRAFKQQYSFPNIIGKNERMLRILDLVMQVAPSRATILITGTYNGSGSLLDAGWGMFYLFWGAAALHPGMRSPQFLFELVDRVLGHVDANQLADAETRHLAAKLRSDRAAGPGHKHGLSRKQIRQPGNIHSESLMP